MTENNPPRIKMTNPWRTMSFITIRQNNKHFGEIRLTNGEKFDITEETTRGEMYRAQSRCICTHIFTMKQP